ncbi:MAG: hypothetical protein WA734_11735 [Candidatus Acidiferrales bacterium]
MSHGAGESIEAPDADDIKASPVRIGHELVQLRTLFFHSRDSRIYIFVGDGPAASLAVVPQLKDLHRRILVRS